MTDEASTTTWQALVGQYRDRVKLLDDARIDELRQSTEHWHDTAQMLKRQRDMAEEERDAWKLRAMQSEQQRQALRAEVVELREDRDSQKLRAETAERDRQIIRKNMDDLIVNVNVAMAERERVLRSEREALLVVNGDLARDNETLEAECEALLSVIERVRPSIHLDAALAVQPTTGGADE